MSRFDYPDPGTDPAYCDPLSPEPDPDDEDPEIPEQMDDPLDLEPGAGMSYCAFCGDVFAEVPFGTPGDNWPYCSSRCSLGAEMDAQYEERMF